MVVLGRSGHIQQSPTETSSLIHQRRELSKQYPIHEPVYLHKWHQLMEYTSIKHEVYPIQETLKPFLFSMPIISNRSTAVFTFDVHSDIHLLIHSPLCRSVEKPCQGLSRALFKEENYFRHEKFPALDYSTSRNFLNCKFNQPGTMPIIPLLNKYLLNS